MDILQVSLASQELRRVTCECSQSEMFKKLAPGSVCFDGAPQVDACRQTSDANGVSGANMLATLLESKQIVAVFWYLSPPR